MVQEPPLAWIEEAASTLVFPAPPQLSPPQPFLHATRVSLVLRPSQPHHQPLSRQQTLASPSAAGPQASPPLEPTLAPAETRAWTGAISRRSPSPPRSPGRCVSLTRSGRRWRQGRDSPGTRPGRPPSSGPRRSRARIWVVPQRGRERGRTTWATAPGGAAQRTRRVCARPRRSDARCGTGW